ncbi:class I SAM-dependent methyltransferase [Streptomyces spiramyceticus]|uniref:class I SAM-dependent methyltransferase n=1 Tax=Streptomyces spiramyceticus TaxID=299717 RepID=UPI00237B59F3|nr:class I SAM-dependent methyltransferase [Streptomyces spiramyceticus]
MPSLLSNRLTKWALRPVAALVDQRISRSTAGLRKEVTELRRRQHGISMLLDRTGRGQHRMPTPDQISTLVSEVGAATDESERARRNVTVAYRNVVAIEALGVGRMAGGTSNVCGKLATIPLLAPRNGNDLEVLEIGTLHGLFAAALMRMLHRTGIEATLTIVDPLAGSQLQPGTSDYEEPTGTPVREDVVRANLALGGGRPGVEARIRQGFSGDPDVRAEISDRKYGVIVVDGDHSFEGVRADLEWVELIAAQGGIVVLDDYGDGRWPGVKDALDKHLAGGDSRLQMVGRVATSAFLRAH